MRHEPFPLRAKTHPDPVFWRGIVIGALGAIGLWLLGFAVASLILHM